MMKVFANFYQFNQSMDGKLISGIDSSQAWQTVKHFHNLIKSWDWYFPRSLMLDVFHTNKFNVLEDSWLLSRYFENMTRNSARRNFSKHLIERSWKLHQKQKSEKLSKVWFDQPRTSSPITGILNTIRWTEKNFNIFSM